MTNQNKIPVAPCLFPPIETRRLLHNIVHPAQGIPATYWDERLVSGHIGDAKQVTRGRELIPDDVLNALKLVDLIELNTSQPGQLVASPKRDALTCSEMGFWEEPFLVTLNVHCSA